MGDERNIFLSTVPATRRDRVAALAVVAISAVLFACALPFATVPLPPIPAFIASYQSALAINDLITAILLYSQFALLRSRALLLLASGYLFAAAAAIIHALSFPGLFAPTGLFNSGPQTTAWLYQIWHTGFPLLAIGYAVLKDKDGGPKISGPVGRALFGSIAAVGVTLSVAIWIVTVRHDILPTLLGGTQGRFTPVLMGILSTELLLSFTALLILWLRRPYSVLDVWLMVVMFAWLCDIALSGIVNAARFDLGFYAGRLYGLCAASFVLAMLLVDNIGLQARLARLLGTLRREARSERNLRTERDSLFSAVVESSNDAIITQSMDGSITGWNGAAERLFGFTAAEAIGKSINMIVPPDRRDEIRNIVERVGRGDPIAHYETSRVHKDGRAVDVSLSVSPIRAASGKIIGVS
jgi:PAS domain S-box-containing protein